MTADDDDDDNRGGGRGGRGGGGGDAAVAAASAFKIRQMPVRQLSATDPLVVCGGTGLPGQESVRGPGIFPGISSSAPAL